MSDYDTPFGKWNIDPITLLNSVVNIGVSGWVNLYVYAAEQWLIFECMYACKYCVCRLWVCVIVQSVKCVCVCVIVCVFHVTSKSRCIRIIFKLL